MEKMNPRWWFSIKLAFWVQCTWHCTTVHCTDAHLYINMAEIALWWQNNWSRMATRDDRQYDYCIVWPAFVVWTTRHTTQHNCIVMKWNISLRPKRSRIRNGILIDHIVMVCSNILNALYRKLNVGCGAGYMEDNATKMCWCEWQCDGRWLAVPALIMLWWHEWTDQILIKSVKFPLHSAW